MSHLNLLDTYGYGLHHWATTLGGIYIVGCMFSEQKKKERNRHAPAATSNPLRARFSSDQQSGLSARWQRVFSYHTLWWLTTCLSLLFFRVINSHHKQAVPQVENLQIRGGKNPSRSDNFGMCVSTLLSASRSSLLFLSHSPLLRDCTVEPTSKTFIATAQEPTDVLME